MVSSGAGGAVVRRSLIIRTLRDKESTAPAIFFRSNDAPQRTDPVSGKKVVVGHG
jgi:hypothetical protein